MARAPSPCAGLGLFQRAMMTTSLFYPSAPVERQPELTPDYSRLYDKRFSSGGAEKAWQAEGTQDARLGEAIGYHVRVLGSIMAGVLDVCSRDRLSRIVSLVLAPLSSSRVEALVVAVGCYGEQLASHIDRSSRQRCGLRVFQTYYMAWAAHERRTDAIDPLANYGIWTRPFLVTRTSPTSTSLRCSLRPNLPVGALGHGMCATTSLRRAPNQPATDRSRLSGSEAVPQKLASPKGGRTERTYLYLLQMPQACIDQNGDALLRSDSPNDCLPAEKHAMPFWPQTLHGCYPARLRSGTSPTFYPSNRFLAMMHSAPTILLEVGEAYISDEAAWP